MSPVSAVDYLALRSGSLTLHIVYLLQLVETPYVVWGRLSLALRWDMLSNTMFAYWLSKTRMFQPFLGMDTLQRFGSFGMDWTHHTLTLGDAKLLLHKRCHGSVLSPVVVFLISDHVIPPHSQYFVHAGSADYGPDNQDALFSPFMDKMARLGILVGVGVVAAGPQSQIPVAVMNNRELHVKLFAGTRIVALSPVRVKEDHPDVNTVTANLPPPPRVPRQGAAAVNYQWLAVELNCCISR